MGIDTHFIVADGLRTRPDLVNSFPVTTIEKASSKELSAAVLALGLAHSFVLLHYVGYGYASRGCPIWLVKCLETLVSRKQITLFTSFHELWATSRSPLESPFWLAPLQKHLIARLLTLTSESTVSLEFNARRIRALAPSGTVSTRPVFSTTGECEEPTPFQSRHHSAVVFGTPGRRIALYHNGDPLLKRLRSDVSPHSIFDIGAPLNSQLDSLANSITTLGLLEAPKVNEVLRSVRYGLLDYPQALLGKSSIFAAYAAFGVIPIIVDQNGDSEMLDGLIPGQHFLTMADFLNKSLSEDQFQQISSNLFQWYHKHSVTIHAETFWNRLHSPSNLNTEAHVIS